MSEVNVILGRRIRELRLERRMTQEELAFAAGLPPAHLSEIERGNKNPTVDTISGLANAMGIPIVALFETAIEKIDDENIRITKMLGCFKAMTDDEQDLLLQIVCTFYKHTIKNSKKNNPPEKI